MVYGPANGYAGSQASAARKPCKSCGNPLALCPMCDGGDDYGCQGQDGFFICQDEDCLEYEFCCGC